MDDVTIGNGIDGLLNHAFSTKLQFCQVASGPTGHGGGPTGAGGPTGHGGGPTGISKNVIFELGQK